MTERARFFWSVAALIGAVGAVAALAGGLGDPAATRAERAAVSDRMMRHCWHLGGTANLSARNIYAGCSGVKGPQP